MSPTRGRRSAGLLLALFVVVPLLEVYVIIRIGHVIGAWWTILLLLADGALGTWLVRREGRRAWSALVTALRQGRMPSRELSDGIVVLVGGTLMLAPGFLTDIVAVICLVPLTRPLARAVLGRLVGDRLAGGAPGPAARAAGARGRFGSGWTPRRPGSGFSGRDPRAARSADPRDDVVRGEVVDPDPGA